MQIRRLALFTLILFAAPLFGEKDTAMSAFQVGDEQLWDPRCNAGCDWHSFPGQVYLGTIDCTYRSSCNADEACIFKMDSTDNSLVADCTTANKPMTNNYSNQLCCTIKEICWDGIDNDLNGAIDCADSQCNGNTPIPQPSSQCTNPFNGESSPYNTSGCITGYNHPSANVVSTNYNPVCKGNPPDNTYYYCGFGPQDNPNVPLANTPGTCCPVGIKPFLNSVSGAWECQRN